MSWVLSCETSTSKVLIFFCCGEGNIISCEEWRVWDGPCAVGDRIVHNAHRIELDGPSMRKIEADKNGPATIDQAHGK